MTKTPPRLNKGDQVGIVCPASKIDGTINRAIELLESWGLSVYLGKTVKGAYHQFSGTDEERAQDLQFMLDNPEIKAVFAARGGYGSVRIIDRLDFTCFSQNPKWLIGFSDITVIHSHVHQLFGIPTIHGQMPLTLPNATKASLNSLKDTLFGQNPLYNYKSDAPHQIGETKGILIGGNLALLVSLLGSVSDINYENKILFIEDVGEYYYAIDRMLWTLQRAGKLAKLKGLIVGGFTGLKDKETPFGFSISELVKEIAGPYGYPIAFDFPAGHVDNNYTLILGKEVSLKVERGAVEMSYELPVTSCEE